MSKRHLDQVIRGALGVLRLAQDFSPTALETVCGAALKLEVHNYHAVRDLLRYGVHAVPERSVPSVTATLQHDNVRGAAYYSGKKTH